MTNQRMTPDRIQDYFWRIRANFTDGRLYAVGPDGWFVPAPDGLPDASDPDDEMGETALDLVVPECRAAVLAAWGRCRNRGAADTKVRLMSDPDTDVSMLFVDLRDSVGTFALLLVAHEFTSDLTTDESILIPRLGLMRRDETSHFVSVTPEASAMFGWAEADLVGRRSLEFIHPDDHDRAIDNWLEMLGRPGQAARWRGRFLHQNGSWVWVEITNHNRLSDSGEIVTEFLDIREEMAVHEALSERERLFRQLMQALPVGVAQIEPDGSVVFANNRMASIVGIAPTSLDELRVRFHPDDQERFTEQVRTVTRGGVPIETDIRLVNSMGDHVICQLTIGQVITHSESALLLCLSDVTEKARLRDELEVRATFDALTNCHNRASTLRHLAHLLRAPDGPGAGVIFIDLDRFKPVNDEYGHATGDALLQLAAERLRACTRAHDVVGRLGGDEFVVLFTGVADETTLSILADRVNITMNAPVIVNNMPFELRASLGTSLGRPGDEPESVLAAADQAMYRTKRTRLADASGADRERHADTADGHVSTHRGAQVDL